MLGLSEQLNPGRGENGQRWGWWPGQGPNRQSLQAEVRNWSLIPEAWPELLVCKEQSEIIVTTKETSYHLLSSSSGALSFMGTVSLCSQALYGLVIDDLQWLQHPFKVDIFSSILHVRKLRLREVKCLAKDTQLPAWVGPGPGQATPHPGLPSASRCPPTHRLNANLVDTSDIYVTVFSDCPFGWMSDLLTDNIQVVNNTTI